MKTNPEFVNGALPSGYTIETIGEACERVGMKAAIQGDLKREIIFIGKPKIFSEYHPRAVYDLPHSVQDVFNGSASHRVQNRPWLKVTSQSRV